MSFRLLALVGPTASGKSALGIQLAKELGEVEIISADAMQLYKGMDIGTAKVTEAESQGIPHHLLSVAKPSDELTVVQYRELFDTALADIGSRGKLPLAVGGSTLYLAAALDEMQFAPTDPMIRERLEQELKKVGALELHARLREKDPISAEKISPKNSRKVIRALEVIELSGTSFAASLPEPKYRIPTLQLGLNPDREVLLERVQRRVEQMWAAGFLDEVRELFAGGELSRTAAVAIGYSQARAQLAGELGEEEAKEETVRLTMRYAKKQMTWFRRDKRIKWLNPEKPLESAIEQIRLER